MLMASMIISVLGMGDVMTFAAGTVVKLSKSSVSLTSISIPDSVTRMISYYENLDSKKYSDSKIIYIEREPVYPNIWLFFHA